MSKKYRIKLQSGRVIGPFAKSQVGELYQKGHINGGEECQYFPAGDWAELKDFPELAKLIYNLIQGNDPQDSETHASTIQKVLPKKKSDSQADASQSKNTESSSSEFQEFKFSKDDNPVVDYDELEQNYSDRKEEAEEESAAEDSESGENSGIEKTRVISRGDFSNQDVDKTVVVNPPPLPSDNDKNKESEGDEKVSEEDEKEEEEPPEATEQVDFGEKTEFADINSLMGEIQQEAKSSETEFEKKKEELEIQDKPKKKKKKKKTSSHPETEEKQKRMKPIVAIAFLVVIWVLLDEDGTKKKDPVKIRVQFPVVKENTNQRKAMDLYKSGVKSYKEGSYTSKVYASSKFRESLSNKFKDNPSLGYLILTYAELYPNATNPVKAASTLFRLIKIGQSKVLSDPRVATGTAIFYANNGKYLTAVNTIENFLRVDKPSKLMLAVYLEVLIKSGDLAEAGRLVEKIKDFQEKPTRMYIALSRYYEINERFEKGKKVILEGMKKRPKDVQLLLALADYFFREQEMKNFESALKEIDEQNAERSPIYYAKYLEYMGILSAYKGDKKKAANLFKIALKMNDSRELRSKLAALDLEGDKAVNALVLESKVVQYLEKAKRAVDMKKWEDAFVYAIEATDMLPTHIGAKILLSEIQIERGFFQEAIETLKELKKDHPLNIEVQYYLGLAYIRSSKIQEAENHITRIDQRLHKTPKFTEVLGRFYQAQDNVIEAIKWYKRSIKKQPLNDKIYFSLAEIYLENRKYDNAKEYLTEAIYLDPRNVFYRSAYAKILFELEGASTAIGYLRDVLEDHPDHPKLVGDIAIYYYKNGQVKQFETYKERVEDMNTQSASFYEFMLQAAELEDRDKDVIKYAKELIKVNPGDLETRMMLGRFFLNNNRLKEAEEMFETVISRLDTYPKVYYYLAKLAIKRENIQKAEEYAKKEIENNPELEFGHYIMGEVHRLKKEGKKAVKNYEKSISYNGKYIEGLMGLALLKYQQNYLDEARELYERAKRYDNDNPEIWKQLGKVYRETGQSGLAVEAFETYLKLNPGAQDRSRIEGAINRLK